LLPVTWRALCTRPWSQAGVIASQLAALTNHLTNHPTSAGAGGSGVGSTWGTAAARNLHAAGYEDAYGGEVEAEEEAGAAAAAGGDVQVSTVDSFQGQEKEIIILSLCGGGGWAWQTLRACHRIGRYIVSRAER